MAKIDVDFIGDNATAKKLSDKYVIKIMVTNFDTAIIVGAKENLLKFLIGDDYGMDYADVEELFPDIV